MLHDTISPVILNPTQRVEARLLSVPPRDIHPLDNRLNKVLKRTVDVSISLGLMCFVLCWLIPVLALLIKLTSKGPIFFVQQRTGYNNKTFACFKLRSMYVNEHAHTHQATVNDSRVTPAGKILRKYCLDELPQFYNVLKGEMSVIGPRPHMLKHTEEYSKGVSVYLKRHSVKPGITGLSQVMGYRGEITSLRALNNRVKVDIFYLKNWNLGLDVVIVFRTIKLVLFGD